MGKLTRRSLLASGAALATTRLHAGSFSMVQVGNNSTAPQQLQSIKQGVGGQALGLNISNDNTNGPNLVCRADVYGYYKYNSLATTPVGNAGGTGAWQQLLNTTSMPGDVFSNLLQVGSGGYEIAIAPSDRNTIYMVYPTFPFAAGPALNDTIYKSTDGGATFTKTGFTPIAHNDANGTFRLSAQRMAIHPTNPNIVFMGFEGTAGLWATADGGATWGHPSGISAATTGPYLTGFQFDPVTPSTAYVFRNGDGLYRSTNANLGPSSTWSKLTLTGTAPTAVDNSAINSTGAKLYVCQLGGPVFSTNFTSWTQEISGSQPHVVACDPNTANHVVVVDGTGNLNENNGSGWSGFTTTFTVAVTDIPWQSILYTGGNGPGPSSMVFDRSVTGKLYIGGNEGLFTTTISSPINTGTTIAWTSMGVGNEELNTNTIVCPVSGGPVTIGVWDSGLRVNNLSQYPTAAQSFGGSNGLSGCWSVDNAKFTNVQFIAAIIDNNTYGSGSTNSAYSADNGSTWTAFRLTSDGVHPCIATGAFNGSTGAGGGNIATSTPTNMVWGATSVVPKYTTDGGITWASCTFAGSPSWTNYHVSGYPNAARSGDVTLVADPNNVNTFYLFYTGVGIYKTTNSGANWSLVVGSPSSNLLNNCRIISAVPGQSGHLWFYLGGLNAPLAGGGGPTFGSPVWGSTNITAYPNNAGGVYYTTDGGATFNQCNNANFCSMAFGASAPGQSYPAIYGCGYVSYAASDSRTISNTGTATFTVGTGLTSTYRIGAPIGAWDLVGGAYMAGTVQSYNNGTGVVTIALNSSSGSGTKSSWFVSTYGIFRTIAGPSSAPVWESLGISVSQYMFDTPRVMCADPGIYGQIYIGYATGMGMNK